MSTRAELEAEQRDVIDRLARMARVHTRDDDVIAPIRRRLIRRATGLQVELAGTLPDTVKTDTQEEQR